MRALRLSQVLGVISAAALVADLLGRKLTKEFLESEIDKTEYNRLVGTITHCTITTKSGFTFTGESACVDPNNFNHHLLGFIDLTKTAIGNHGIVIALLAQAIISAATQYIIS